MIYWLSIFPLIYLACAAQLVPITWGQETFQLAILCSLMGVTSIRRTRMPCCVLVGVLDAMLSQMPVGIGLIWAGIVGLLFAEDDTTSAQQNPLLLQLLMVLLIRQFLWFLDELYQNKLTMSLDVRLLQTGFSLVLPLVFLCLYTGMLTQIKQSFQHADA